jgi:hypothetical protein
MAVIMMFEAPGATLGDDEETNAALGIHGDKDAPDGLVWHTALTTNDGVLIVDVWESEQKLRRFFEDRLQTALAQAGVKPGEARILPLHNMFPRGSGSHAGTPLVIEVDGFGPDTYDRMTSTMDAHVRDGSDHPAVEHTAAITDRGMLVADIWESPEAFARFAETQVASAGRAVGLPPFEPLPDPQLHPQQGGGARKKELALDLHPAAAPEPRPGAAYAVGRRRWPRRSASIRRRACCGGRAPRSAPRGRASRRSSRCSSRAASDSAVSS